MIVVPNVDYPEVQPAAFHIQTLAPVGVIAPAVDIRAVGDGLVQPAQLLEAAGQRLRVRDPGAVRTLGHRTNAYIDADGPSILDRR